MKHRLAILSTHPIQYNAPLFRLLHSFEKIHVHVFYSKTWAQVKYDPDFQRDIEWDVPLIGGYPHSTHDCATRDGLKDLISTIDGFTPQAILVYGWNFPGHLTVMRHYHGKISIWFRGDSHLLDPLSLIRKSTRRTILKWVYRHIDLAFDVGSANKEYFQWSGVDESKCRRAPHAIDSKLFTDDQPNQEKAKLRRSALGIKPDEKVILFAGKLELKKQPEFLIEAWKASSQENCHLIIGGSGPLESHLREIGDHPRIHFIGFQNQSEMPSLYRMADLFCLPSKGPGETWGLSINESIAVGTPCLASNRVGCSKDVFITQEFGMSIPWNSMEDWTKAIESHWPRIKQASIKKFNNEFSLQTFSKALYTELSMLA